jgi:sec-independent protein translocase protein TatB
MFDIDGGKLLIIGIVALVVIGPKELPGVMRQVGQAIARLRRMASEFQGQFMDAMREAELDELQKDVKKMATADLDGLDPFHQVRNDVSAVKSEIETALEGRAADPALPSPASVDLPHLAETPADGEVSLGASGIAPVADTTEPVSVETASPRNEPAPAAQPAGSGGHA